MNKQEQILKMAHIICGYNQQYDDCKVCPLKGSACAFISKAKLLYSAGCRLPGGNYTPMSPEDVSLLEEAAYKKGYDAGYEKGGDSGYDIGYEAARILWEDD
jgi:hypothetical protein